MKSVFYSLFSVLAVATLLPTHAYAEQKTVSPASTAQLNPSCELQARMERAKNAYIQVIGWAQERRAFKKRHPLEYLSKYYLFSADGISGKRSNYLEKFRQEERQTELEIENVDRQISTSLTNEAKIRQELEAIEARIARLAGLHEIAFKGKTDFPLETSGDACRSESSSPLPLGVRSVLNETAVAFSPIEWTKWGDDSVEDIAESEARKARFEVEGLDRDFLDPTKCETLIAIKIARFKNFAEEAKAKKSEQEEKDAKKIRDLVEKAKGGKSREVSRSVKWMDGSSDRKRADTESEAEMSLDDDKSSSGKASTDPSPTQKTSDPQEEIKERKEIEVKVAVEKKKILEKLKREYIAKAEIAKKEIAAAVKQKNLKNPPLTPQEKQFAAEKIPRAKSALIQAGKKFLENYKRGIKSDFQYADFFMETEFRERQENGDKLDRGQFQRTYARYLQSRKKYERIAHETPGTGNDKIMAVSKAINEDFGFNYASGQARMSDMVDSQSPGSCVATTKLVFSILDDLKLKPDSGSFVGIQVYDNHMQPVLFKRDSRKVTSLVINHTVTGLTGPIRVPEYLGYNYLESESIVPPLTEKEVALEDMTPQELKLAQDFNGNSPSYVQNANSKFAMAKSIGVRFSPQAPPGRAIQPWQNGAGTSLKDYYAQAGQTSPSGTTNGGTFPKVEFPDIDFRKAQEDMRAAIESKEYQEYMRLRRDPTLLTLTNYTEEQIKTYAGSDQKIFEILGGEAYVSGPNKWTGVEPLQQRLLKDNPELMAYYQFTTQKRADYNQPGEAGDLEKRKYLELFKGLGVKNWNLYRNLEKDQGNDFFLATALGKSNPGRWAGPIDLNYYVIQEDRVGFLANYQKGTEGDPNVTEAAGSEGKGGYPPLDPARAGAGNDSKGIQSKPEPAAFTKLEPVDFAQFVAQTDRGRLDPGALRRWTPALSAALRNGKRFEPELVEWFMMGGYRKIADTREESRRVISGPDKNDIPKDIAVLLVDFLRDNDHTTAEKRFIKREITSNYGSVEKYIEQVKSEFKTEKKKPDPEKIVDSSYLSVFKRLAAIRNMDASIFEKAEMKSFEFLPRAPETLMIGENESSRKVRITKPYEIQLTPVTQLQWYLVMKNNPSLFKKADTDGDNQLLGKTPSNINHPVENVSWEDVQNFINILNISDIGSRGRCTYRLPTEAEYEAAARAKTLLYMSRIDPNIAFGHSWYLDNSANRTHAVATKKPGPEGLYDMEGNVLNWVQDLYEKNPQGGDDPTGAITGVDRVVRGASFRNGLTRLHPNARDPIDPDIRDMDIGFRLVRTCL